MENQPSEIRLPRRQFIADLLFAGGVVTLAGRGAMLTAAGYVLASVVASVAALYLGKALV